MLERNIVFFRDLTWLVIVVIWVVHLILPYLTSPYLESFLPSLELIARFSITNLRRKIPP